MPGITIPPVGTLIEVVVQSPGNFRVWGGSTVGYLREPDTMFRGRVLRSAPDDPKDTFRLSTDVPWFPERIIAISDIRPQNAASAQHAIARAVQQQRSAGSSERPLAQSAARVPDETWSVPSSTGHGSYAVTRYGRSWQCDCPGFTYHRGKCRHLDKVMAKRAAGEQAKK